MKHINRSAVVRKVQQELVNLSDSRGRGAGRAGGAAPGARHGLEETVAGEEAREVTIAAIAVWYHSSVVP